MSQRGFTLLEVMVAFIIAAFAVAALLQGAAGGLRNARVASHTQEALARAQSRLALLTAALTPGEQAGDDGGGYAWRVSVTPGPSVTRPRPGGPGAAPTLERTLLYDITVRVRWTMDGGSREVALATQRLGLAPAELP